MADRPGLLLVGGAADRQDLGVRCIRQAQARGLRVIVTDDPDGLAASSRAVAAADAVVPLDRRDVEGTVAWARAHARAHRLVGVYCFREYAVLTTAAVADALGLPGNPPAVVADIRDKYRCRERLRARGFPQPAAAICDSIAAGLAFVRAHPPGPWIVKPPDARGSLGVSRVDRPAELAAAHRWLPAEHRGRFLVECFQAGREYSAEGVFLDGRPRVLAVTEKHLIDGSFVELGHIMPAPLPAAAATGAAGTVERAVTALGLRYGQFHVELWRAEDGHGGHQVVLGEVHNRPGGDFLHLLTEVVTGVEAHGVVFDQLLGRPVALEHARPRAAAAASYHPVLPPGRLAAAPRLAEVESDPALVGPQIDIRAGDLVRPLRESADRPVCVAGTGRDPADAWITTLGLAHRLGMRVVPAQRPAANRRTERSAHA